MDLPQDFCLHFIRTNLIYSLYSNFANKFYSNFAEQFDGWDEVEFFGKRSVFSILEHCQKTNEFQAQTECESTEN